MLRLNRDGEVRSEEVDRQFIDLASLLCPVWSPHLHTETETQTQTQTQRESQTTQSESQRTRLEEPPKQKRKARTSGQTSFQVAIRLGRSARIAASQVWEPS